MAIIPWVWSPLAFSWMVSCALGDTASNSAPNEISAKYQSLLGARSSLEDLKLAVDHWIDPGSDPETVKAQIDGLAEQLLPMLAGARGGHEKLKVLRRFLYEAGPWNGNRPFAYDHSDPLGRKTATKLLRRYIETRLGNCVTMPMLVMILGRRIGLNMTLAVAPFHVFVKFTDEHGRQWNLEATSGAGYTRDEWYSQNLPMTDLAVAKGTYLRALSDDEAMALIVSFRLERDMATGRFEDVIAGSDTILNHYPGYAAAWLYRGSAFTAILRRDIVEVYQPVSTLPPEMRPYADALYAQNMAAFAEAEALGWTEQDGQKKQ
jgi:regulator of sirC expression with transglutaminase-like and TPR domain